MRATALRALQGEAKRSAAHLDLENLFFVECFAIIAIPKTVQHNRLRERLPYVKGRPISVRQVAVYEVNRVPAMRQAYHLLKALYRVVDISIHFAALVFVSAS